MPYASLCIGMNLAYMFVIIKYVLYIVFVDLVAVMVYRYVMLSCYSQETRLSIRLLLLQTFGCMCSLEVRVIQEFLNSVLPLELARDIQHDTTGLIWRDLLLEEMSL